jgi:hypothetical protein
MTPLYRRTILALGSAFLALQLVTVSHTNPPVASDLVAGANVTATLRRSCYDCHSNETQWRLYAYIAPVSWLIASDVEHARARLNFSEWGLYPKEKRRAKAREVLDEIASGDMPPKSYSLVHPGLRPTAQEIELLKPWADGDP